MIRKEIEKLLIASIRKLYGDISIPRFSLEVPENLEHGDYATNVAMALAKVLKKNPMEVAQEIIVALDRNFFEKVEVALPGFINLRLKDSALAGYLQKIDAEWGKSNIGAGKTVMVEYFQLNIAKRPHVGHLRSAVIGDAIKRMLLSQGYNAISDTHVGDWGTQFGMLLWGWKNVVLEKDKEIYKQDPFKNLEKLYSAVNLQILQKPEIRDLAKDEFAKLERGDKENREIWQWMIDASMQKLKESASRLGLRSFNEHKGESSYESDMPPIIDFAFKKSVAKKTEDGAVVVDLESEKLDQAVLLKSDGASTYLLRDLATIQYRKKAHNFWRNIYIVDVRQSHHFNQFFRVAELLGFEVIGESAHIDFGFMSLPEGALSTRKGNIVSLDAVLDEVERRALAAIEEKNPELPDKQNVAKMVGLGALKYFDLSHNRKSDIVFKWDEALAFEGNTGPYLQYTHARLKSILRKAGSEKHEIPKNVAFDDIEHQLLAAILQFPEAIEDALEEYFPNILANYLFKLGQKINEFYHSHPVIQEADNDKRELRSALVWGAALTLKNGLDLLGIEAPEEM